MRSTLPPRRVAAGLGAVFDSIFTYLTTMGTETPKTISAEERDDMFREPPTTG